MTEIRNWFDWSNLPLEQQNKLRRQIVLVDKSFLDAAELIECGYCATTGKCERCNGSGDVERICDCQFCRAAGAKCGECAGSGKCPVCAGEGFLEE